MRTFIETLELSKQGIANTIRSILPEGSAEVVEDILQETNLSLWESHIAGKVPTADDEAIAFCCTIAHRSAVDMCRSMSLQEVLKSTRSIRPGDISYNPTDLKDKREFIDTHLADVCETKAQVFRLRMSGESILQIEKLTGLSGTSIRRHIKQTVEYLRSEALALV